MSKRWLAVGASGALDVERLNHAGEGVGRLLGGEVVVRGALPGERVQVRIEAVSQQRPVAYATLLHIDRDAPARRPPPCQHAEYCGGCDLQHVTYPGQLHAKRYTVRAALGEHPGLSGAVVDPCRPSADPLGYRYLAKWVLAHDGALARLGAYARRSHDVISIWGCLVHRPGLENLGHEMAEALSARPWLSLGPNHRPNQTPQLRYAVARESSTTGELALVLISTAPLPGEAELAADIASRVKVASISRHTNNSPGDALFDPSGEEVALFGPGTLKEKLAGVEVEVPVRAFSQVNPAQAAEMRALALSWLAPEAGDTALDLYAGVGEVALSLAEHGAKVISVERSSAAVETARAAARAKGYDLDIRAGDAAEQLSGLSGARLAYLNPPRAGASSGLLARLAELSPERIVYTSCSPQSFARDAAQLVALGYALEQVTPFDLFPQTAHVELVARFTRRPAA